VNAAELEAAEFPLSDLTTSFSRPEEKGQVRVQSDKVHFQADGLSDGHQSSTRDG
jgi:hypothetical protein